MNNYIPNIGKIKFKKPRKFKGKRGKYAQGWATKSNKIIFGRWGFQATSNGFICPLEIEASRRSIVKKMKKEGKLWIRCYPYKPYTSKGSGMRMGKGKGSISRWTFPVKKGQILFEVEGPSASNIKMAFRSVTFKLSVRIKLKKKEDDTKTDFFKNFR